MTRSEVINYLMANHRACNVMYMYNTVDIIHSLCINLVLNFGIFKQFPNIGV